MTTDKDPNYRPPQMSEEDFEFLISKGFRTISYLGEGNTRRVYEATRPLVGPTEEVSQRIVLKVPKDEDDCAPSSVSTIPINMREIRTSARLSHPNISSPIDTCKTPDGRVIAVEVSHPDVFSLEQRIRQGVLQADQFGAVFTRIASALGYMHRNLLVHRDVTPANILVSQNRESVEDLEKTFLTDFDNSGHLSEIESKAQPTRGGIRFTHPRLLESLAGAREDSYNVQDEIYALGATMYYGLSGKHLFDYSLRECEDGTPIMVNGRNVKVGLFGGYNRVHKINPKEHNTTIEQALVNIPRQWRSILRKSLMIQDPTAKKTLRVYKNMDEVEIDLRKASRNFPAMVYETVRDALKPALIGAAVAAGIVGAGYGLFRIDLNRRIETMKEILGPKQYAEFVLDQKEPTWESEAREYVLFPQMRELKERLPRFLKSKSGILGGTWEAEIESEVNRLHSQYLLSKRFLRSWLTACYFTAQESPDSDRAGQRSVFLPVELKRIPPRGPSPRDVTECDTGLAAEHFQLELRSVRRADEVLARYFFSSHAIAAAMIRSRSELYLPNLNSHVNCGYRAGLDAMRENHKKVSLTDRAIGLLILSSDEAGPDFSKIERWEKDYATRLRFQRWTSLPEHW